MSATISMRFRVNGVDHEREVESRLQQVHARAAELAADTEPPAALNASPDYKRHLAPVLCRLALEEAAGLA